MNRFVKKIVSFAIATLTIGLINAEATTYRFKLREYGECRVTAYSGNNGSTYGASEEILIPDVSCAASRDIPFGTLLYIESYGVVKVDDRFNEEYENEHNGMVIDLYLDSYESACDWGMSELNVYFIESAGKID